MPSSEENVMTCPHYAPSGATGPEYVCRGCGSLVSNPNHQLNQTQGITRQKVLGRPESVSGAKRLHV